ncbi:MAG: M48 family metallopeptidase [Candidatus Eremiobacteraeota bacterium]|nr:M48 family metallopeptidase [Candidatus Eremiobacteraeota bacterium]
MQVRRFLVGAGAGLSAGYAAVRTVQAVRETLRPSPTRAKDAAAYGRLKRALAVDGLLRGAAVSAAFAYGGGAARLSAATRTRAVWLHPALFTGAAMLLESVADLPADFIEGYSVERTNGLTEQSVRGWLADRAKETAVTTVVSAGLAVPLAAALRRFPKHWALLASAATLPLAVLANLIVPVYVLPLFNTFEKLDGPLERRLRALARQYGVGDAEILRMNMSRQTTKANAFVTGIGSVHRIVVGDTLIDAFTEDEIAFVVAHELGHYVSRDSWRMIAVSQVLVTASFLATQSRVGSDVAQGGEDPTTIARLFVWVSLVAHLAQPALAAFTRSREWAADRFALEATRDPGAGAAAFRRLRDQNLAEDAAPAWYEFLFGTHPPLKARIAALEAARASGLHQHA